MNFADVTYSFTFVHKLCSRSVGSKGLHLQPHTQPKQWQGHDKPLDSVTAKCNESLMTHDEAKQILIKK